MSIETTSPTIPRPRQTRSVRRVLAMVATIAVLAMLAPTASASSHKQHEFHLAKTCDAFPICVVTASSYRKIPVGTEISYADTSVYPSAMIPTINAPDGSATGLCDLSPIVAGTGSGTCVFHGGGGSLKHFRIELTVTFDGSLWYWDGTFHHKHGHGHRDH
jgi:hypothetical protein